MNIFVLDKTPEIAAKYHSDQHVVKMILESAQMACTTYHLFGLDAPYRMTHANHPCTQWVRESRSNYLWLYRLAYSLNEEYKFRFRKAVNHKSWDVFATLHREKYGLLEETKFQRPLTSLTNFAQAMPEQYRSDDGIEAYRRYYALAKIPNARYTFRNVPYWVQKYL